MHQLKRNNHVIGLFASGPSNLNSRLRPCVHPCDDKPLNTVIQYDLVLYDIFRMMIAKILYFDLFGKKFDQKFNDQKFFKQNLRHQVAKAVEAEGLWVEAIQKLPLSHPWYLL